ncbi:glycosyltransferase family 4 protein [Latilactobacillus graminis]|uniref:Uncharacterized protein n=2 Tax=Latilactobacillus graminis TaxID=60519 RepID=A0AA89L4J9_9LACO|nr:glycosyltransferase family 4 protein [Latilactobacillus graminis]KRM21194.1 hypothetical protein FC90_GL001731 [Latilactobacillus graminis DSM 20719]QFP79320.1 glycosyltransferase family 4 protein [Latilactobacillus graminis]
MKVIYLHQYFATRNSTTATRTYEIAKKLVQKGHQVTMITTDAFLESEIPFKTTHYYREYLIDGIVVKAQRNHYENKMGFYRRTWAFLKYMHFAYIQGRKSDGDLLLATSTPLTIAIPTLMLHVSKSLDYIFEVRDLWPEAPKQMGIIKNPILLKGLSYLERTVYRHAKHIISLSPGMTEGILAQGIKRQKVTMIPNFSDLSLFQPQHIQTELQAELIKQLKLQDKFVLLHLGAMGEANGLMYLIEAAKILQKKGQQQIVIIIGGDGKVRASLQQACQSAGLTNVLLTGYIKRKNVPTMTSIANITMTSFKNLPVLATNSPNKFFDALAAGKPIIVNANGWTKEIVEKNQIGYYVRPTHPEDLALLLVTLQNKKQALRALAPKIRAIAQQNYSAEHLTDQVETILVQQWRNIHEN